MQKLLLLGDEAIAQGAIDGGMSGIYAYPGTPSTEIMEYVQISKEAIKKGIQREWSANEKTAMETAIGMSYAGKRAMACMKHVGLNVAADPFMNSAITRVNGGLIITVADDPSMHSSQNEQDSRFFAKFAMIPILEPSNQQEAYDMAYEGFEMSERLNIPVMIRITTRLAHSRSGIERKPSVKENPIKLPDNNKQFILLPSLARCSYDRLLIDNKDFDTDSENSIYNKYFEGNDKSLGVIACGLAYNYLMENYLPEPVDHPVVKICQYPVPVKLLKRLYNECDEILVLEEGSPLVEEILKGIIGNGKNISGRLSGVLPRAGELNPDFVAEALGKKKPGLHEIPQVVKNRPPSLCKGCGHVDILNSLNAAIADYGEGRVFSDIGCYTLGALPPFNAIYSCVDMGASVTMAKGAADAGLIPSVAVIGDSTFTHSGMTGLLDVVNENSPITVIISDNLTTGMTGGQKSSATGRLYEICTGIGVDPRHVKVIIPLKKNHEQNTKIIREELKFEGVSVIISQRECIQTAKRRKSKEKTEKNKKNK